MSHWQGAAEPLFGIAIDLTPHAVVSASPPHARQPLLPATRPNSDMPPIAHGAQPAPATAGEQGRRATVATQPRGSNALVVGAIGLAAIAFLVVGTASRSSLVPAPAVSPTAQGTASPQQSRLPTPMEPNVVLNAPAPAPAKTETRVTPLPRTRQDGSRVNPRRETSAAPAADAAPASEPLAVTLERLQSGIR